MTSMTEDVFCFDLVLTRGPASIARRVSVRVPLDGTPVTVGRAPHCNVVLDPRLVFTSQVQCNVYCVVPQSTPSRSHLASPQTPSSATQTAPRIFISDLCSSNGTFVNRRRVGGTDPVELHDGDAIIFGGMRDVEVGELIPEDAFTGPELVVWCVAGLTDRQEHTPHDAQGTAASDAYAFEETPMLLPTKAALDEAERALLQTALQSLRKVGGPGASTVFTPTPSARAQRDGAGEVTSSRPSFSPADVQQVLFAADASPVPPATAARPAHQAQEEAVHATTPTDARAESTRRSGTVAARLSLCAQDGPASLAVLDLSEAPSLSAEPPQAVHFHALRLGQHRFHVPDDALIGACAQEVVDATATTPEKSAQTGKKHGRTPSPKKGKKKGAKAAKREGDESALTALTTEAAGMTLEAAQHKAPFRLFFTHTHWKWTMNTPLASPGGAHKTKAADTSSSQFHALLPITSVESVLVCAERCGVAVELKEGRQLPLVDADVMAGGPENRWIVFLLEAAQLSARSKAKTDSSVAELTKVKPGTCSQKAKKSEATPATEMAASAAVEPEQATLEPLDFEAWVSSVAHFYSSLKFPEPLYVDAADFDLIYAPPTL